MSYTIEIIHEPVPPDNLDVLSYLDRLEESDAYGEPTPAVLTFYQEVVAKFPCITQDPDGPWADGPLINNFRYPVTILGISFSGVGEVLTWLIPKAAEHGFTVYDPQDDVIHRPTGPSSVDRDALAATPDSKPWWRFW
jgi:hypothetical protein